MSKPLPASEELANRYELLVANISDYAIYMLDPEGMVSSWNAGAQRFKGYLAHEIIGKHFSRFYTPEDQTIGLPARALRTALKEGRFESEGWRVRKDGTRFWASVVVDPIYSPGGLHLGFAKITRDITERRAAQEALHQSEQRFRLLVEGVTDYAIYMLSPTGEVNNWNVGAERIKGYARDEVLGSNYRRFFTEEDQRAGTPEKALAVAAREGRFESEGWRVRKDGSLFWANAVIDAIVDDSGTLLGFAKITRDITEKRKLAETLEQTRAALFQAQRMEAIGQVTGGVAHDFNNLLGVISSGIDILQMTPAGGSPTRVLDGMRRAVERGALLTQQLLSFARQQPLDPAVHQLNELISDFEGVLRRAAGPAVRFELDLGHRLAPVSVDEARFEAALLNLVVNAHDAMPDGGTLVVETRNITLAANAVAALPAGDYVRVVVRDSGTGMMPAVRERALEPFFTTKDVGKGTGLGLSQVYGFIVQSGGEVVIDTAVGFGTSISLYLPALTEHAVVAASVAPVEECVLIVEDDPLLMATANELFQIMGYRVLTAEDGVQAMQMLAREPDVNVLFSDILMPNGMSGLDLAREVRQRYPDMRVILASGYPNPALVGQQSVEQFSFVSKPYRVADLARLLRTSNQA